MLKDISIKELRENLASVADRVEKGESFRVIRRSKPSFFIMKIDEDASGSGQEWETLVDFTDEGAKEGVALEDAIQLMRRIKH